MYFWGLVKKVVQQVEDLSFFLLFLLFYKKVKKSEKKYKKVFSTFPNVSSIKGAVTKPKLHQPTWPPPHIELAATIHSTPQHFSGTYCHPPGTWMTMHLTHLPHHPESGSTAREERSPNLLTTAKCMPPFATTPSASFIDKACLETPTPPSTPPHRLTKEPPPLPLPSTMRTPPLPPNSLMSSTPDKSTTYRSHQWHHPSSMSPLPLLCLSKRLPRPLHFMSTSTPKDHTPLCHPAWLKQYSASLRRGKTLTTQHVPWPMASSPPYIAKRTLPTNSSPKPTPTSTNSRGSSNNNRPTSGNYKTGWGTSRCPQPMSGMEDEWTSKCPPRAG